MGKVVVTRKLTPDAQELLNKTFPSEKFQYILSQHVEDGVMPRENLLEAIRGANALICLLTDKVDDELLDAAGDELKVVSTVSVGYDHVDISALHKRGIKFGYTPGVLTDATADLTALLTLAAARRVKEGIHAAVHSWGEWSPTWLCGAQLSGKTLGVVGMGRIGQAVAKRLRAFGIDTVLYCGRTEKTGVNATFVSLDQLLSQSDFITVCCALTPDTQGMFNYDAFRKMKKNAVFVNTARGGLVNQEDLVRALKEKEIAAAGLDVTTPEPLPKDHALFELPNCIILPHLGSATMETREKMAMMCIENIKAGLAGEPLPNGLDLEQCIGEKKAS